MYLNGREYPRHAAHSHKIKSHNDFGFLVEKGKGEYNKNQISSSRRQQQQQQQQAYNEFFISSINTAKGARDIIE
jgi:hypothetical protein